MTDGLITGGRLIQYLEKRKVPTEDLEKLPGTA